MVCTLLGNKVFYTDEGKGPAVLFLPGPDLRPLVWHNQVAEFSSSYRVLRLDLSGIDASRVSLHDLVRLVDEFALFKELRQMFLVGCGAGGFLACAYAARHPNMVNGLVVSSVGLTGSADETIKYFIPEYKAPKPYLLRLIDGLLKKRDSSYLLNRFYTVMRSNQFLQSEFLTVSCPVLVINGESEHPAIAQLAFDIYAAGTNTELEIIEGAASLPNITHFDEYNITVRDFIRTNISPL